MRDERYRTQNSTEIVQPRGNVNGIIFCPNLCCTKHFCGTWLIVNGPLYTKIRRGPADTIRRRHSFHFVGYWRTLSVSRLYNVEWWDDRWIMNRKGFRRKRSWPNTGTISALPWKNCVKPRNTPQWGQRVSRPRFEPNNCVISTPDCSVSAFTNLIY
jgi:hypothetical protein